MPTVASYRCVLRLLLTAAYLCLAFASAVHPASHALGEAAVRTVSTLGSTSSSAASSTAASSKKIPASQAEHGERGCFFCLHGPTVLLLAVFFVLFVARTQIRKFSVRVADRTILPPTLSVISLRAPPAFA